MGEQAADRLGEPPWFAFDLLPRAAGDAPACQLQALLPEAVVLKSRIGVVKASTIRFDDQPSISPEEVRLEGAAPHVERDVDLRSRQSCTRAHAQEHPLQFAASSLGFGMKLVEKESEPGNTTAATVAPNEAPHPSVIENPQYLSLSDSLPEFPDRSCASEIEQSALDARAGDPVNADAI